MPTLPHSSPDGKVCTRCSIWKPLSEYYGKGRKRQHHLQSWCKACACAAAVARWEAKRDARRVERAVATGKQCTVCGAWKFFVDFHRRSDGCGDGYKSACKTCRQQEKADYRERNKERLSESGKAYYQANQEKLARWQKEYREANPERIGETRLRSRRKHKDRVNADTHKRRNRLVENGGHWTAAEWKALKAQQGYRCLMCGKTEPEITLTVDHIVPVSEGGSNDILNLQGLCRPCNSRKHRQTLDLRG